MNKSIIKIMNENKESLIESMSKRNDVLQNLPEGNLNCYKSRNNYTWYDISRPNGKPQRILISKHNRKFAESLALRAYHESALATERHQLKAVDNFIRGYRDEVPGSSYLKACPEHLNLLKGEASLNGYTKEELSWMNDDKPYEQPFCESAIIPTVAGYNVKSKSEAEYVTALINHKLVFRYEWPIHLRCSNTIAWPDFTIIHPETKEIIYLEHFGLMDSEEYVNKNAVKLHNYLLDGILPGKNLFISYESKLEPFTSLDADAMIRSIFF